MSTKSTVAPQYIGQFAEATKLIGDVHNISSGPKSKDKHAICKADVQLLTAMAYFDPVYSHNLFSKIGTAEP